jgi:DNA-binding MarR family transcriptional regulator
MRDRAPLHSSLAVKRASLPSSVTHPQKSFILGVCEALGPDTPLRRVLFLLVLWEAGEHGISAGELERRVDAKIGAAQSTTSRTVRLLTNAGLVESYLYPPDHRSCMIRLTGVARVMLRSLSHQTPPSADRRKGTMWAASESPVAQKAASKDSLDAQSKRLLSASAAPRRSKKMA